MAGGFTGRKVLKKERDELWKLGVHKIKKHDVQPDFIIKSATSATCPVCLFPTPGRIAVCPMCQNCLYCGSYCPDPMDNSCFTCGNHYKGRLDDNAPIHNIQGDTRIKHNT